MRSAWNALCLVMLLSGALAAADGGVGRERWIYCPTNLLVDENVDKLADLFRRGAASGYTHIFIADSKFGHLGDLPDPKRYLKNVSRVKQLAAEHHLEVVPGVFPIGWSNDLLYNDPNLAEGLPVRDALFVVQSGEARLVADPPVALKAGDMSNLKSWEWHDPTVTLDAGAARITDPSGQNARLVQSVVVKPFRQYHVSVRIKTQNFQGTPEIKILAGDRQLNYNDLGIKPTQDWTLHHTVFNSLENAKVGVYLGCWGGNKGSLWYDDAQIEEVGLLNVVRRPGAPVTVVREGESKPLVEGADFEAIVDPRMGNHPWQGEFETWHPTPPIKTSLPDGSRLRVSYYHPLVIYGGSVMIALSEPKTMELLADQARRMHETWGAGGYFMQHDEIRLFNWDKASQDRALTAGAILADNVKNCTSILEKTNPGGKIYVWSDMFDPHHNAVDNYYLVRGSIAKSWDGLDKRVIIVNWNSGKASESLKFFADRGHKTVIAGYYDAPVGETQKWLDAAKPIPGVEGIMYTTWQNNYADLEAFAKAAGK